MIRVGFQASHEQFAPGDLLRLVRHAETAGFQFVLSSDHINPWSDTQDNSGFAWSWLGAAMQATSLPFSVVTVPGYRYHPAILAQAIATLCAMFPGRFNPCLGSGEALNEHVVGRGWPEKAERNLILEQSVRAMRRLWQGERVDERIGNRLPITINQSRLYTLPPEPPKVYGAALTTETAGWLGSWADGLITVSDSLDTVQARLQAFRSAGGRQGDDRRTLLLKAQLCYNPDEAAAVRDAMNQWRPTLLPPPILGELPLITQFEGAAKLVTEDLVRQKVKIITEPADAIPWIEQYAGLGFDVIILHNVGRNQEQFITDFGREVLPHFNPLNPRPPQRTAGK